MSTTIPPSTTPPAGSFADDVAGMGSFFIDPQGAARRLFHKWFWVGPFIVVSIVSIVLGILVLPIAQHAMETMAVPSGTDPERFQKGVEIGMTIQRVAVWLSPLIAAIIYSIDALVLLAAASVAGVSARFGSLFNLAAGCSLIALLERIAAVVILKAKGEVTVAELQPPMGLDIFLPEGTNKFAMAFLGYFSIFQIWWIVMMVLIFAAAFRVRKGKAFAIVLPLILLGLVFKLATAAFQRT
jgi:hypothetical protein